MAKKNKVCEKYIPNTNKRYSITEEGIIYSNFRYSNNGKKYYNRKEMSKHFTNKNAKSKSVVVSLQLGKLTITNKPQKVFVNTLMEKCFKLKPPDKFHYYDLIFKDGNCFNSSLDNLAYRIRTKASKFYPQPFYNKSGKITHKVCGQCGLKKEISKFSLQKPREDGQNRTYRNNCENCRSKT